MGTVSFRISRYRRVWVAKVATERPDIVRIVRAVEPEISGALARAASIKATQ